ncbi:MAG: outer membrane beta-barrel protein [Bacteroidales bacterium]|nr:outer membrane beta-barrel protein [Bacteroidales bacterium]
MTKFFKKVACLTVMVATVMSAAMAQDAQPTSADNKKIEFSLHLGGAFPMSDFGDSRANRGLVAWLDKTEKAGAGTGFDAGMKFKFNIPSINGLGVILTADFFYNGPNNDVKDWRDDLIDAYIYDDGLDDVEIDLPKYINVPIMLGVNYDYVINEKISVWGEAGIGANIRKITMLDQYLAVGDEELIMKQKYDIATTFAFQIGAGVKLMDKVSLGFHYYALGSGKVKGMASEEYIENHAGGEYEYYDGDFTLRYVNPTMFVIRLGYHF